MWVNPQNATVTAGRVDSYQQITGATAGITDYAFQQGAKHYFMEADLNGVDYVQSRTNSTLYRGDTALESGITGDFTLMLLHRQTTRFRGMAWIQKAADGNYALGYLDRGSPYNKADGLSQQFSSNYLSEGGQVDLDVWNIMLITRDNGAAGLMKFFINGADVTKGSPHTNTGSWNSGDMRDIFVKQGGEFTDYADLVWWDKVLTPAQMNDQATKLSDKYGLGQTWAL